MTDRSTLPSLQGFRGAAAIAVVLHHAALSTDAFVQPGFGSGVARWLQLGYLGVDFFFVLSGFIILYVHADDVPTGPSARRYLGKRLLRVYPPYLPISILLVLAYLAAPGMSASGGRQWSLASSLLLLPSDQPPALSVAWTLVHEMVFYTVFLIFFAWRRAFPAFVALWALVILVVNAKAEVTGWLHYLVAWQNLEFVMGMLTAVAVRRGLGTALRPAGWITAGVLVAGLTLALTDPALQPAARPLFGLGMAAMVVGFARRDLATRSAPSALWVLLGAASYSIYLVHNPLLSLTQRVLAAAHFGWLPACATGVALAIAAGIGYHKLVEQPALVKARALLARRAPA